MDMTQETLKSDRLNVKPKEIEKFSKQGWWQDNQLYRTLHLMNPARLQFIYEVLDCHFDLTAQKDHATKITQPPKNLLDIACGGGILTLPLARIGQNLGFQLSGIDLSENAITEAKKASKQSRLDINFRKIALEQIQDEKYDAIFCLEIIEHLDDYQSFLTHAANLLNPNGVLFVSSIRRNMASKITAIYLAEYLLNILPKGTHDWENFVNPSEVMNCLNQAGLDHYDIAGLDYNPFKQRFRLKRDHQSPNYILAAIKPNPNNDAG